MFRSIAWIAGACLYAGGAAAQGNQVEAHLSRPSPAIDPDAQGRIELENDRSGSGQKFDVEIRNIDTSSSSYSLWLEDPLGSATFVDAGTFDADPGHSDRAEYERRTDRGQSLPLGAAKLDTLAERLLEVRDTSGQAILIGRVPDIASGQTGGPSGPKLKGSAPLLRPSNAPLPAAHGTVESERHGDESQLEIETEDFDVTRESFTIWLADAQGTLVEVGALAPDRGRSDHGRAEWRAPGNGLPLGAATIQELMGRRIEVRSVEQGVVLEGAVPGIGAANANQRSNQKLEVAAGGAALSAKGQAKTSWQPARGRFRLEIRAQARTQEADAELWLENPTTGLLEHVATRPWQGGATKSVRFSWDSMDSEPLPFGVTDPAQLLGAGLEVRLPAGTVLLRGLL